ncbi:MULTISPECIES: helix-turn-helix domain-containing protein [Rhodococcus]|uniref:XRE family transcriptional regulator n=1 Tax=Nocardia globerula TaxID=1818 RepID=A0A652YXX9_NOCGL|nr:MULTISPECIES: XRE family transcriptional regulator [Rhodococcus]MDV8066277.1 XRE family transcriptional regulator [Rhodococcus sp. IEGM 1366]NMD59070.1 helix-turn-helix transcriptional regulator [Nocardia globerula]PVX64863.1 XRE family transcriptional regulator [Rhodococcus globerulus]QXW03826.1 XRE family transcriptional regulator [Rhodococcus globerulus]
MTESSFDAVLAGIGPRLRTLRQQSDMTLTDLSEATGINVSTLSRLESGTRRANLELLLPIAKAHGVPLDDVVNSKIADPRVREEPQKVGSMTIIPLTSQPGNLQAYKMILAPTEDIREPGTHEGYEWLYVLSGRVRLQLGDRDFVMGAGEAAEFDTHIPHRFSAADGRPAEVISLFGKQGERVHLRAAPADRRG